MVPTAYTFLAYTTWFRCQLLYVPVYVILFPHVMLYHVIPLPSNGITHLHQYYGDFPTACSPFAFLLALSGIPLIHYWYLQYPIWGLQALPQLIQRHCVTWLTLDPVVLCTSSPKRTVHILPSVMSKTSAHQFELYFGAEMPSDPITSLSTLSTHCYQYTPKTRCRWFG